MNVKGQGHSAPWLKVTARSLGLNVHQNFKYLLLRNHRVNSSKILYRIFKPHGNIRLYNWPWSHEQDGWHAHIW